MGLIVLREKSGLGYQASDVGIGNLEVMVVMTIMAVVGRMLMVVVLVMLVMLLLGHEMN